MSNDILDDQLYNVSYTRDMIDIRPGLDWIGFGFIVLRGVFGPDPMTLTPGISGLVKLVVSRSDRICRRKSLGLKSGPLSATMKENRSDKSAPTRTRERRPACNLA